MVKQDVVSWLAAEVRILKRRLAELEKENVRRSEGVCQSQTQLNPSVAPFAAPLLQAKPIVLADLLPCGADGCEFQMVESLLEEMARPSPASCGGANWKDDDAAWHLKGTDLRTELCQHACVFDGDAGKAFSEASGSEAKTYGDDAAWHLKGTDPRTELCQHACVFDGDAEEAFSKASGSEAKAYGDDAAWHLEGTDPRAELCRHTCVFDGGAEQAAAEEAPAAEKRQEKKQEAESFGGAAFGACAALQHVRPSEIRLANFSMKSSTASSASAGVKAELEDIVPTALTWKSAPKGAHVVQYFA